MNDDDQLRKARERAGSVLPPALAAVAAQELQTAITSRTLLERDFRLAEEILAMPTKSADIETMTVTVRDHAAEAPWGSGLTNPVTRKVTIAAHCPKCGGKRGEPQGLNSCDDGAFYWVETWKNPCGHIDTYAEVVKEAAELAKRTVAGSGGGSG